MTFFSKSSAVAEPRKRKGSRAARMAGDALQWGLKTSEEIRDIGPPPAVKNPKRRKKAIASLESFLTSYFRAAFPLEFSDDHRKAISVLEKVCEDGGLYALGMPRGFGKTTICTRAALWALLTGRRKYVAIIGATETTARNILTDMKMWACFNSELYADFPNELHGLPQMKGQNKKAAGQICEGQHTLPSLLADRIVFPSTKYNPVSGVMVSTCGLTGNIRGLKKDRLDGTVIRPDLIILDDPQTKESARSALQTSAREEIIYGDVLGLAGPGEEISAVMPCTVIQRDDLADRMLKNAEWQATRGKMIYQMPTNMPAWDRYMEIRREGLRVDHTRKPGDDHYRANRAELEAGAIVGWPARKCEKKGDRADISAIQHAMHLYFRNPLSFAAEYQNEPSDANENADAPTFAGLENKLTKLPRGIVPDWAHWITCGIDVQKRLLMYVVLAVSKDWTSSVIEYGGWPEQPRSYFTRDNAHPTLHSMSGSSQDTGAWRWGLDSISQYLCGRRWERFGGGEMSLSRVLIDAGDGNAEGVIFRFCRESPYSGILLPSKGQAITAKKKPMGEWPRKPGSREEFGQDWIIKPPGPNKVIRNITFDGNPWKTFLANRAAALSGESGSLSIYGERPEQHQMFRDHLAAETNTRTFGQGRWLHEWTAKPNTENDYLDALVMAGVAASTCGAMLSQMEQPEIRRRPLPDDRPSLGDLKGKR